MCSQNSKLRAAAQAATGARRAQETAATKAAASEHSNEVASFSAAATAACHAADAKVKAVRMESVQEVAKLRQEALEASRALRQERQTCAKTVCAHSIQCRCSVSLACTGLGWMHCHSFLVAGGVHGECARGHQVAAGGPGSFVSAAAGV